MKHRENKKNILTLIDTVDEQLCFEYVQQLFTRNRLTISAIYFERFTLKLL